MANIDYTYFQKRENKVPNLNEANIMANLVDYIDLYEEEYLIKIMGVTLYNEFTAGLLEDPILDKWSNLLTGCEFEYYGVDYKWLGFTNTKKISPIANYVFFHSVRDENIINSGIGTITTRSENADKVSSNDKLSISWNRMTRLNKVLRYLLLSDTESYASYEPECILTETIELNGI